MFRHIINLILSRLWLLSKKRWEWYSEKRIGIWGYVMSVAEKNWFKKCTLINIQIIAVMKKIRLNFYFKAACSYKMPTICHAGVNYISLRLHDHDRGFEESQYLHVCVWPNKSSYFFTFLPDLFSEHGNFVKSTYVFKWEIYVQYVILVALLGIVIAVNSILYIFFKEL